MFVLRKTLLHGRLPVPPAAAASRISSFFRSFSSNPGGEGGGDEWGSSWSTGITKDHFDGSASAVGRPSPSAPVSKELAAVRAVDEEEEILRDLNRDNKEGEAYVDSWKKRLWELMTQVREPVYLEYSEKQEMYRLHKEDPATYTVERLAKDFRVMRQHVQLILFLKETKKEEERKQGKPLDDSVEILLDSCPENMADPKEKKGSKSYLAWTPEMDTALLTMLVEHHNNGDHA